VRASELFVAPFQIAHAFVLDIDEGNSHLLTNAAGSSFIASIMRSNNAFNFSRNWAILIKLQVDIDETQFINILDVKITYQIN
jgi:hypothetical protein